jgi:tRNA nucleotidyltransferase (CCA-adding enzyme)
LARLVEWQLEHPVGTKDESETWLKAEHEAGRINVGENIVPGPSGKRAKVTGDGSAMKKARR